MFQLYKSENKYVTIWKIVVNVHIGLRLPWFFIDFNIVVNPNSNNSNEYLTYRH